MMAVGLMLLLMSMAAVGRGWVVVKSPPNTIHPRPTYGHTDTRTGVALQYHPAILLVLLPRPSSKPAGDSSKRV